MRGMPHTVKVERHQNELVVHVALLHGPDARLPGGVLLHTEGWVDIGYGLKMFLVIGSGNISYHPKEFEDDIDIESFMHFVAYHTKRLKCASKDVFIRLAHEWEKQLVNPHEPTNPNGVKKEKKKTLKETNE